MHIYHYFWHIEHSINKSSLCVTLFALDACHPKIVFGKKSTKQKQIFYKCYSPAISSFSVGFVDSFKHFFVFCYVNYFWSYSSFVINTENSFFLLQYLKVDNRTNWNILQKGATTITKLEFMKLIRIANATNRIWTLRIQIR